MSGQDPYDKKSTGNSYARFSGMAFQMLATIALFTYGGYRIDLWRGTEIPVWTLILSLFSIAASLYLFIKKATQE